MRAWNLHLRVLGLLWCASMGWDAALWAQTPGPLPLSPAFPIATSLAPPDSDTQNPGQAGVATDGNDFMVAYCNQGAGAIYGALVTRERAITKTFRIADINTIYGCGGRSPTVGYDGTNFLVVFPRVTSTGTTDVVGMRVSRAGDLLDGPEGFVVFSEAFEHAIAFDGTNYLVVSVKFSNDTLHDVY